MVCTACLISLVSIVSGHCKNATGKGSASSQHITNISKLLFFRYLYVTVLPWPPWAVQHKIEMIIDNYLSLVVYEMILYVSHHQGDQGKYNSDCRLQRCI
jgi:hypothetical protein